MKIILDIPSGKPRKLSFVATETDTGKIVTSGTTDDIGKFIANEVPSDRDITITFSDIN